jgi:hypothetical protein
VTGPWPPYHFCPSLELRADDKSPENVKVRREKRKLQLT